MTLIGFSFQEMLFKWVLLLRLAHFCSGVSSIPYGQYKFSIFSLEDIAISPLPRTNKCVISKDNITLLAQLTPMRGQDDANSSQLTEHFFWVGTAPHLTLTSVNHTVDVPFAVELFRRGSVIAWRCQFARSQLNGNLSDINGGQWRAEVSLSRGSGFFATRASLTDVRFVAWSSWPWGGAVGAVTVAPRVGRLRYLQDPCGCDVGLLVGLAAAGQPGLPLATVIGNTVTWYDLAEVEMVKTAFGGSPPGNLSLTSAVMTSAHMFLLTSHGLLVSPAFRNLDTTAQSSAGASFALLRLHTKTGISPEDRAKDEVIHSLSCFINKEDNETVLLLLHSEQRYLLGRAPFHLASSWRDLRTLVTWPDGLAVVSDVRYIWHWGAVFLGYDKGDEYKTVVLPLHGVKGGGRRPCDRDCGADQVKKPHVLLCPLTKKVYLLSDRMSVSMDGGATFAEPPTNVSFGRVEHCVTDLINHHICITANMELVIIGIGSDEPKKIPLTDLSPKMNITESAKTALIMDQAGGVTVYGAGSAGFSSYYFSLESGLPEKYEALCHYYLELLGGVKHASIIHLDVHDIVTVEVEVRRVPGEGNHSESLDPVSQDIDLELSNPSIIHVQRATRVRDAAVRLAATVRPNAWTAGAVCAVTFRLPAVSALCSLTSRVVIFALSPDHHSVIVDVPSGRDPKDESAVKRHVQAGDSAFYELPVNYRPPSNLGPNIPTSDNIYNADPSQTLNQNLFIKHNVSLSSGRFKACYGKANRSECGCSEAQQYSTHVEHSDCRVYVPVMSWPAKLRLTMSVQSRRRLRRPLQAPIYVNVTELNNRSSWESHVLLDSNLARIFQRNLSTRDRRMVDPQRIRVLMKGTGLYHFRVRVVEHTSFHADHDDVLVYVVPARLKSQVQNVVYPMVGITLIITLFVVFEYYHQRYAGDDGDYSDSESEEESDNGAPPTAGGAGFNRTRS